MKSEGRRYNLVKEKDAMDRHAEIIRGQKIVARKLFYQYISESVLQKEKERSAMDLDAKETEAQVIYHERLELQKVYTFSRKQIREATLRELNEKEEMDRHAEIIRGQKIIARKLFDYYVSESVLQNKTIMRKRTCKEKRN
jgi:hypothetical protein